ncbi:MAG: TetR/AcrR family transcriptional regulator [Thermodesulfobacteriota bacterium]|nr:TetR/AcrR family transcriptional regulator [Thermodesulfobacteriota bacterium]
MRNRQPQGGISRKEAIIRAATILFAEKGFKDTSMAELSKVTGAAEGTIFYHFKNKEELFLTVLEKVKEDIIREFHGYLEETRFDNGLDMIEGAITFYIQLGAAMENRFLLLHRHDAYELAKSNPTCRKHLEAIYDCLLEIFERGVVLGQQDGSIRDMAARKAALIIFSMVDALVRFDTYNLYEAAGLYRELMDSCRRMLEQRKS